MRTIFRLLLLLITLPSFAQIKEIFRDDFKDNSKFWPIIDVEIANSFFADGNYMISCKKEQEKYLYLRPIYFDPYEDFSIETKLKLISGQDNQSFGVVWGASDESNFYSFEITASGKAYIIESNKRLYNELKTAENVKVNPANQYNTLKIAKAGSVAVFFLNDEKIFTVKIKDFFGLYIGFVLNQRIQVAADYISVKQDGLNIDVLENVFTGFKKVNLGREFNTPYEELMPVISPDGKALYVACKGHPGNTGGARNDDIWYSNPYNDSTWGPMNNMGAPLNNKDNNSVISVSPDGNTLYLNGIYLTDGTTEGNGVSISHRAKKGWTMPEKISIDNFFNFSDYAGFSISADESIMITSIQRDDSEGELDLYVSFRKPDGSYTAPKNIGPMVNTEDDEAAPFLAADNTTLFFATKGRPGFGSMDIFVTKRLDDSWTKWSAVKNMGPEINSIGWDGFFSVPASGIYAYLVSYNNTFGKSDIFRIPIPPSAQPNPVVLVAGRVLDPATKQPICNTDIEYYDLSKNKIAGKTKSGAMDGTYKIILPYGKIYSFMAKKDSFYSESQYIDLSDMKNYQEMRKDIVLAPIKVGQIIRMNNLFFDTGKSNLDPASYPEIDRLIDLLKLYPAMKIEIAGHTDNVGDDNYNLKLSQSRADAVKNYITSKTINAIRLISKGYGETRPCADNANEFGRSINRRVEFVILNIK